MSSQTQIGTQIPAATNERAKKYQAFVLLSQGRDITIKQAIDELINIGADSSLPQEFQHAQTQTQTKKKN
jgi:hypothetical protein